MKKLYEISTILKWVFLILFAIITAPIAMGYWKVSYWLLKQDDGQFKALDMPYNYIIEMICD